MTKILGREVHPLANLLPMMEGAAFAELVADVGKNGALHPILLDTAGRIIDGRNRGRACEAAGVEPPFETWQGEVTAELVLSLNLKRRHLNESQRAMVAARLAKELEKEAVKRKAWRRDEVANLQPQLFGKSNAKAAEMANVSARLISHAIKVLRAGRPELIAAVDSGAMAVSTAASLAGLSPERQAEVLAGGQEEVARAARELRQRRSPAPAADLGVINVCTVGEGGDAVGFLWVAAAAMPEAIRALEARGFRCASPPAA